MEKFVELFEEYVMKAVTITENVIANEIEPSKLEDFTSNRERLFSVMEQISGQIDWTTVNDEKKSELNRRIEFIKKLDEQLLVKLQVHHEEVRREIEATFKQKENIKGYNLNDVK